MYPGRPARCSRIAHLSRRYIQFVARQAAVHPKCHFGRRPPTGGMFPHGRSDSPEGCEPAQPDEPGSGHSAAGLHGHHRAVGIGEILSRAGHALRRGPAPLCRVALHLRQAVPRPHAEAAGRVGGGDPAGGGHRAEEPDPVEPLDGGHGDRGLRLPAPAVGARRAHALPPLRPADPAGHGVGDGGRRALAAGRGADHGGVSAPGQRARHPRPGGGDASGRRIPPGHGGRRGDRPGRAGLG